MNRKFFVFILIGFLILANLSAQASAGYELAFRALTADRVSVPQYEQFNVNYDIRNPGLRTFEGSLSAFLTDNAGNVITTIGTRSSTSFGAGSGRSSFVTCVVPTTVRPGHYQIRIAVSDATGSERQFITNSLNNAPTAISFQVTANNNIVVAPLIQTQWSPYAPFNNLFPANPEIRWHDSNSGRIHADCGNTALAQIMYYYRHPVRGTGQSRLLMVQNVAVPTVNLNVAYDWDNMLSIYPNANSGTERQRSAVATLFYHVAAANGANGLTYPGSYFASMTVNFGYDRSIQWHERRFYTNAQWEALIRSQLDARMPVYYWGHSQESLARGVVNSHAFIIDGYDNQGRFHMNIGNNGQSDGWYTLNNIGNRGWWPDEQHIIINIKPDAGGVSDNNRFGLNSFSANKTSVSQNESFAVNFSLRSFSIFPGGQVGAALVDANGGIIDVIRTENYNAINPRLSRTSAMNCSVPATVRPGQYRLMIITRPAGGEWKPVALSDINSNVPNSINITVAGSGTTASQPAVQPATQPTAQQPAAQQTPAANAPATITINNGQRVQFGFTAPSAGTYIIESANNGTLDPVAFSAASGSGSANIINDDGGEGRNFQFARDLRAGETITFFAGVHGDRGSGSYTINIQTIQSITLVLNSPATVAINNGQRIQLNFTAPSAGEYTFESSNNGTLDPVAFSVASGTGSAATINDDSGQGRNFRFTRNLGAGEVFTFFAGVHGNRGSGSYTVNVQSGR